MASTSDCGPCPLKSKCCPNAPQRMIPRDVNEDARDGVVKDARVVEPLKSVHTRVRELAWLGISSSCTSRRTTMPGVRADKDVFAAGGSVATDWAQAQGNAQVSGLATSVRLEQGESTATCPWFGLQGNDCEDSHLVGVLR